MKKLLLIIVVLFACQATGAAQTKQRVQLKPENASGEILLVNAGKLRPYYPLTAKKSTVILLRGPGELRVLTRARFLPKTKGMLNYRVAYKIDGGDEHRLDVENVKRSNEVSFKDELLGIPGDSHDLTLRLGRGYHSLEFSLVDTLPKVVARYLFEPGKDQKTKWVAFAPLAPFEPVDILAKEETAHYFRFSSEKPLKLEVIGPTEVRLLTRVENNYDMQGQANYRVQLRQFGQVIRTYQMSSRRSETTKYADNTSLVPGKAREIVFKVPKGKQVYEIAPLSNVSILAYLAIPERDVNLEE